MIYHIYLSRSNNLYKKFIYILYIYIFFTFIYIILHIYIILFLMSRLVETNRDFLRKIESLFFASTLSKKCIKSRYLDSSFVESKFSSKFLDSTNSLIANDKN